MGASLIFLSSEGFVLLHGLEVIWELFVCSATLLQWVNLNDLQIDCLTE